MSELYKIPGILKERKKVWAIDCDRCGKPLRLGSGNKSAILRLLALREKHYHKECEDMPND